MGNVRQPTALRLMWRASGFFEDCKQETFYSLKVCVVSRRILASPVCSLQILVVLPALRSALKSAAVISQMCGTFPSPSSALQAVHTDQALLTRAATLLPSLPDLDEPVLTVHQTISDVRGSFYQEKTVFLRCTVNSNPPARFIWKRGAETLSHSQDNGVDIYEPLYTQVKISEPLAACVECLAAAGLRSG